MSLLVTQSLIGAWNYLLRENPYSDATTEDTAMDDFMKTLRREPTPTTEAMQNGIDFEEMVTLILAGEKVCEKDPWFNAAKEISGILAGAQLQVKISKHVELEGEDVVLHGRLDALKAGTIYDIKFSKGYDRGKFINSPQHPLYLDICPDANEFSYLISDGNNVWTETYRREEVQSIQYVVRLMFGWLKAHDLWETYTTYWGSTK